MKNLAWLGAILFLALEAKAQKVGTDISGLNLCLYGDCEARGAYAADPYGWVNPATLPVGTLPYGERGTSASGSYFRLNAGHVAADIGSGTVTLWSSPWVMQVNGVYAEASGRLRNQPVDLGFRTRIVRLAAALDLDRTPWKVPGLSIGLIGALPVTDSDLKLTADLLPVPVAKAREDREVDLTVGLHWRGGVRHWFMSGIFLNAVRNPLKVDALDLNTFETVSSSGSSNAWFVRAGVSVLPGVAAGWAEDDSATSELLGELRIAADLALANITVPGEGTRNREVGYFGLDTRIVPDRWNPVSAWLRPYLIAGVDSEGGWGAGLGLYGNGPLQFVSCNPAYSSRPSAESLGERVDIWSATCSLSLTL